LREIITLPSEMKSSVSSCLKIMSNMDIAEKRVPQDGGIKLALDDGQSIDFRVSSLPNLYGEKIVLRVLGTSDLRASVDELGFEGRNLEQVREAVANPYGMILVTGPTGSGKTTTLYTILNQINEPDVNIVTAEDPVEYRLNGITQVNVRPTSGLTFDAVLRSFLRQDPDIILVGEMRDYETAAIATKAALTGHLVLSTLHTNDAPSTVVRLVDMGMEPYLVASAVKLVIAQRLLRRICTQCKVDVDLSELEKSDLDQTTLASVEYLARGVGCEACGGLGYKGRIPVFEVLSVASPDMKRAITEGGTEVQVGQIARREGMLGLGDSAIELVNKGVTSLEEAARIIMAD
jgi:type IV pilus assembly protein PilB